MRLSMVKRQLKLNLLSTKRDNKFNLVDKKQKRNYRLLFKGPEKNGYDEISYRIMKKHFTPTNVYPTLLHTANLFYRNACVS